VSSASHRLQRSFGASCGCLSYRCLPNDRTLHASERTGSERIVDVRGFSLSPPFLRNGLMTGQYSLWRIELGKYRKGLTYKEYRSYKHSGACRCHKQRVILTIAVTISRLPRRCEERSISLNHGLMPVGESWFPCYQALDIRAVIRGADGFWHFGAYAWLAIYLMGATLAVTLFDRRFDRISKGWRDGIAEIFYPLNVNWQHQGKLSSQSLTGWLGCIWAAAVADVWVAVFPISPLRVTRPL